MNRRFRYGGFTIVEAILVTAVVAMTAVLAICIVIPLRQKSSYSAPQLKDSTQVRGIHQALIVFAQNNNDRYPLPSLLDKNDATVADKGAAKDTTANIFSILIFGGQASAEMFINPAEANGNIKVDDHYDFEKPKAAVSPSTALWDPAFSADFTKGESANNSYAHILPSGARLEKQWINAGGATDPIVGDRGPEVKSITYDKNGVPTPTFVLGKDSITNLIHGARNTWEGNMAFNDNHVEFLQSVAPDTLFYTTKGGVKRRDTLFYDEPDEDDLDKRLNRFLGIFTKAGPDPGSFTSIWD